MKVTQLVPYFGKLPDLFPFFLKTVALNKGFDWMFFIDDDREFETPSNVKMIKMSFEELKSLMKIKLNENFKLEFPHKICDYRPAFGIIFEDWLTKYDFWGHCDLDVIYGDLGNFLTSEILQIYDKIFLAGHFSLYRNSDEINHLYKSELNGVKVYKKVFNTERGMVFDEIHCKDGGIVQLLKAHDHRIYTEDFCINFDYERTGFYSTLYDEKTGKYSLDKNYNQVCTWEDGKLWKHQLIDDQIVTSEHMYIHFHKRAMKIMADVESTSFLIVPNMIIPMETISKDLILKHSKKRLIDYQLLKIKYGNLKIRFRNIFQAGT